jgi:5-hydroxyisourate hydrolase
MSISTHVLDATSGRPAAGVSVTLLDATGALLATRETDSDGRIGDLRDEADPGVYLLRFDTGVYFGQRGVPTFYPEVVIAFEIVDAAAHHHVPLLLSPYAYSTYRGS